MDSSGPAPSPDSPWQQRVRAMVEAAGGQRRLAERIGKSDANVINWLRGSEPYDSTLRQIADRTGIDYEWLANGTGDSERELDKLRHVSDEAPADPRQRLRWARERAGMTLEILAKRVGYNAAVLRAVENGQARASERMLTEIAKVLPDAPLEILAAGSDHPKILGSPAEGTFGAIPDIRVPPGSRARYVPLLSWAQAGALDAAHLDDAYDYTGVIAIDVDDPRAFSLEIRGDSMEPKIGEGDRAIICPSWQPRSGDTVVCKTTAGDVMCKIYQPKDGGSRVVLSSWNPVFPPFEISREEIAWIYPVAQVLQNLRRD